MNVLKSLVMLIMVYLFIPSSIASIQKDYESALSSFNQQQIDTAYIHLKNALNKDPNHLPSKMLMGKTLMGMGLVREGLLELQEAQQGGVDDNLIAPHLANAYLYLEQYSDVLSINTSKLNIDNLTRLLTAKATAATALGDNDEALRLYEQAVTIKPTDAVTLLNKAYFHLYRDEFDQFEEINNEISRLFPGDFRLLRLTGERHKREGRWLPALSYFEKAYALEPSDPLVLRSLASAQMALGREKETLATVEKILSITSDDPFALLLKARITLRLDPSESNDASQTASIILSELKTLLANIPETIRTQKSNLIFVQAMASYLSQDFEQATSEFEQYLSIHRGNKEGIGLLAFSYLKTNQDAKALEILNHYSSTVSTSVRLSMVLCNLYLDAGKSLKCIKLLEVLKDRYGDDNLTFKFMDMRVEIARQRWEEAAIIYERYFADLKHPDVLFSGVTIYAKLKAFDKALSLADTLLIYSDDSQKVNVHLLKAGLYADIGQFNAALKLAEQVLDGEPNILAAKILKTRMLLSLAQSNEAINFSAKLIETYPKNLAVKLLHAETLLYHGEFLEAEELLIDVRAHGNNIIRATEVLVDVYRLNGELENALAETERLIRSDFSSAHYLEMKIGLLLQLNRNEEAGKSLKILYGMSDEDPVALASIASKQKQVGLFDDALNSIKKARILAPQRNDLALQEIQIRLAQKDLVGAQTQITQLKATLPDNPSVELIQGELFLQQGNASLAEKQYLKAYGLDNQYSLALVKLYQLNITNRATQKQAFEKLIQQHVNDNPDDLLAVNLFADYSMVNSSFENAIKHYQTLLQVQNYPNMANVLNNIANAYLRSSNDIQLPDKYSLKALEIAPNNSAILSTRGWVLALKGEYEPALDHLRRAFVMDSEDPSNRYYLAYTLYKLGRIDEAKREISFAVISKDYFIDKAAAQQLHAELMSM